MIAIGCGGTHRFCYKNDQDINYGSSRVMKSIYEMGVTNHQLDSICVVDGLSQDFNNWINTYYIDYETRDTIYKHTFIKRIDLNEEVIYVVTEWKDSLAIIKRVRK